MRQATAGLAGPHDGPATKFDIAINNEEAERALPVADTVQLVKRY